MRGGLAFGLVIGAVGCGDDAGSGGAGLGGSGGQAASCSADAGSGSLAFVDNTVAWGLGAITGSPGSQAIVAADINGDGYPDLVVHGFADRMPVDLEVPFIRVLLNVEAAGGGRTFVDFTAESGYPGTADDNATEFRTAHFAAFGDLDADGDLDAVSATYNSPSAPLDAPSYAIDRTRVLLNDGQGRFTYAAASDISPESAAAVASVSLADIDLDGRLDVFESVWYTRSGSGSKQPVFFGNGDGTFVDRTKAYGVDGVAFRRPGFGTAACDLDGNGYPELLTQSYGRQPNMLWKLESEGFVDLGASSNYAYDDNQSYEDDQVFRCWCQSNADDARCEGVPGPSISCGAGLPSWVWGVSDQPENLGGNTFSTVCGDVDGDGRLDLFTGEITHWWAGQSSDATNLSLRAPSDELSFDRQDRAQVGLEWVHTSSSWDEGGLYTNMADFDNDGRLDLVVGASDYVDQYLMLFHQRADGSFEEIATAAGIDHPCASSPVVADFDRDGDLDLVVGGSLAREFCNQAWGGTATAPGEPEVRLYENRSSEGARGFGVRLRGDGVTSNRDGIGAQVTVVAGGRAQMRELNAGHGHFSMQDDTVLFFGVGNCETVESIEVRWPTSTLEMQRFENVAVGALVEIVQGEQSVVAIAP
jgi:enediyne biosynthesis protein E4